MQISNYSFIIETRLITITPSPYSEGTELVSAVSAAQQWASTGKGGDAQGTTAVGKVISQSRWVGWKLSRNFSLNFGLFAGYFQDTI